MLAAAATAGGAVQASTGTSNGSTCGRIVVESRMKLPVAAGRWSALWMMPLPQPCPQGVQAAECGAFGVWPRSGEIDIVEQVNTDPEVLGVIHFADAGGNHRYTGDKLVLSETALQDWSIFQLVWDCTSIGWYVNSQQINQVTKQDLGDAVWPFDEPFFLMLNTAVGGWLTGNVAADKGQTRPFMVDYVRVYAAPSR
jgi:beta-glucanase (GH16 family)